MSKPVCSGSVCYVEGRWGRTYFIGKDEYVGRSLASYGEYNPDETEKILHLATGRCLDIGANFGVIGQALEGRGLVVESFEPQPDLVKHILTKNVKGRVHNTAVGSSEGWAEMPKISFGDKANYGGMGIGFRSVLGTIRVPVTTIDSFGWDDVGFMKIDVEGFEEEVLRGATETIKRCRPIMYIEDDRVEKSATLRAYITSLGYSIEEHKPALFRPDNYFNNNVNVWGVAYESHNLICLP